jgi:hypothetical protein
MIIFFETFSRSNLIDTELEDTSCIVPTFGLVGRACSKTVRILCFSIRAMWNRCSANSECIDYCFLNAHVQ